MMSKSRRSSPFLLLVLGAFLVDLGICRKLEQNVCVVGDQDGSVTCQRQDSDDNTIIEPLIVDTARFTEELQMLQVAWGEAQQAEGPQKMATLENIAKTYKYMTEQILADDEWLDVRDECKVRNKLCSFWAAIGECEANPNYMQLQCAPSCQTCHNLSFERRCPFNKTAPSIWSSGDLNAMFHRITTDPFIQEHYTPTVWSSPATTEGPWVVTLENVLTPEECEALIELGTKRGYERSMDVGAKKFDGTFDSYLNRHRTSTNTWCLDECYNNTHTQAVLKRLEAITLIPDSHSEYLQLLKYEETQYYQEHHDYIPFHNQREQGVRILTVFLYLNDVEAGGGTRFPRLDITVEPKQGRVLIWPSVKDGRPNRKDGRTNHEALPVEAGVKYAANAWVHERDFKSVYAKQCS